MSNRIGNVPTDRSLEGRCLWTRTGCPVPPVCCIDVAPSGKGADPTFDSGLLPSFFAEIIATFGHLITESSGGAIGVISPYASVVQQVEEFTGRRLKGGKQPTANSGQTLLQALAEIKGVNLFSGVQGLASSLRQSIEVRTCLHSFCRVITAASSSGPTCGSGLHGPQGRILHEIHAGAIERLTASLSRSERVLFLVCPTANGGLQAAYQAIAWLWGSRFQADYLN